MIDLNELKRFKKNSSGHTYSGDGKEIFTFLKKALRRKDLKKPGDIPVRGPSDYREDGWQYTFTHEGDMKCFSGREQIFLNGELVFFQDIIGGLVIDKLVSS